MASQKATPAEKRRKESCNEIYRILNDSGKSFTKSYDIESQFKKNEGWLKRRIEDMRDMVNCGAPLSAYPISGKKGYKLYKHATDEETKAYFVSRFGAVKKETERMLVIANALQRSDKAEIKDLVKSYYDYMEELHDSGYRRNEYWMEQESEYDDDFYY